MFVCIFSLFCCVTIMFVGYVYYDVLSVFIVVLCNCCGVNLFGYLYA